MDTRQKHPNVDGYLCCLRAKHRTYDVWLSKSQREGQRETSKAFHTFIIPSDPENNFQKSRMLLKQHVLHFHLTHSARLAHEAFTSLLTECMPFCVFSAVTCSALLAPPNGIRQGCTGTTTEYYNTVCLFSCNAGFIATGSPSRKCLRNGTWSGQEFLCQGEINYYSSPYRRMH